MGTAIADRGTYSNRWNAAYAARTLLGQSAAEGADFTIAPAPARDGRERFTFVPDARFNVKPRLQGWAVKDRSQRHPSYESYRSMRARCLNPENPNYRFYGARGITICERWLSGEGGLLPFECFARDMGERPQGLTLERNDNDGNYEPGNCRWATRAEQNRNKRRTALIEGTDKP